MAAISIPDPFTVGVLVLYFGLSVGWHIGKAMTRWNERRQNGDAFFELLSEFLWGATHHYDLGIGIATVGVALLMPAPPARTALGLLLFGFGVGMAYDDRQDHPPGGMIQHIAKQVRTTVSGGVPA